MKAGVRRQQTESRPLSDWQMAISLFHSKRGVRRNRYVGWIPLDLIPTNCDGPQQGYAKGTSLPTVGQIEVAWYAPGPGPSKPPPSELPAPEEMGGQMTHVGNAPLDKSAPEEEAVASGWGDDGEDAMGML